MPVLTRTAAEAPVEESAGAMLLVDKPAGWTSFDVIRYLRRHLPWRKLGHAGTLDPMATGLLILLLGPATRHQEQFMHLPKTYTGRMRLGEETASYDAETPVVAEYPWEHLTEADLEAARQAFLGPIRQKPPMYSAVKVGGERLYRKARRGETVEVPERTVEIYRFELGPLQGQEVDFEVECSKGTYIRSLVHDFGRRLGSGAHLVALRRTAIGPFRVEEALSPEEVVQRVTGASYAQGSGLGKSTS